MATLKDVAELAAVDISTVSRALNNTSYVHPDTKARIYAAAKELGYRPNLTAKALRQGRRYTIGMVVPRLHLAIFSEILQGAEREARKRGYATVICVTEDDPKTERDCLERLRGGLVDGIIIAATGRNNRLLRDIEASEIAVVQLVREQEPRISSIVADYEMCGYDAVRFLYDRGCRNIGLISGSLHLAPYRKRQDGYCRAVRELGLEENLSECEYPVNSFEYGYACAKQLLNDNDRLDAIIAAVDVQGLGATRFLTEGGKTGEQIKVMSLTGHSVGRMLQTTMTSMEMPAHEMGANAARMVIEKIEAPASEKPSIQHMTFATTLVERESTGS